MTVLLAIVDERLAAWASCGIASQLDITAVNVCPPGIYAWRFLLVLSRHGGRLHLGLGHHLLHRLEVRRGNFHRQDAMAIEGF